MTVMKYCSEGLNPRCGDIVLAQCVSYELELPSISKIETNSPSVQDTIEDLYTLVEGQMDANGIDKSCLGLEQNADLKTIIKKLVDRVCEIEIEKNVCNMSIEDCGIDTTGLVDPCNQNQKPKTLGALLNAIINKIQ